MFVLFNLDKNITSKQTLLIIGLSMKYFFMVILCNNKVNKIITPLNNKTAKI